MLRGSGARLVEVSLSRCATGASPRGDSRSGRFWQVEARATFLVARLRTEVAYAAPAVPPIHTLAIYVDGSDLDDCCAEILGACHELVESRKWLRDTWVVNDRHPPDPDDPPDWLPIWNLGINHVLPDPGQEAAGWFEEVALLTQAFARLADRTNREFVIAMLDSRTGITEDVGDICGSEFDVEEFRRGLG